jgi:hypothetical protein
MTMFEVKTPLKLRLLSLVAVALAMFVFGAASAIAAPATVKLRIEGATGTQFNGTVTTSGASVPGGEDRPACRANASALPFSSPNALTAAVDALGAADVATSGTFWNFGTMLCAVNGEFPADANGGWLIRINQQDATAPNGYVTATDPLSTGDSVLFFLSPAWGHFGTSLELRLPAEARPGEPVTGFVDSYDVATDAKSAGSGASISGGGVSTSSGTDGSFQLSFSAPGRHLVTATKSGAVRGSQWVTVDQAAEPKPLPQLSQAQIDKQRRVAARANCRAGIAKAGAELRRCIRTANRLGRTPTPKQRRVDARAACVKKYPVRGTRSRVRCVRAANRIGL